MAGRAPKAAAPTGLLVAFGCVQLRRRAARRNAPDSSLQSICIQTGLHREVSPPNPEVRPPRPEVSPLSFHSPQASLSRPGIGDARTLAPSWSVVGDSRHPLPLALACPVQVLS